MQVIGVDLGFGQVKVSSKGGYNNKFLSVVGTPSSYELAQDDNFIPKQNNGITISFEDSSLPYYVGEKAVLETDNGRMTFAADKTNRDTDKIKYLAALGPYANGNPLHIVTGLPVFEYNEYKDKLCDNMEGTFKYIYNGNTAIANVRKVSVIPQSAGAFFNFILDDQGEIRDIEAASKRTLVIDPGSRTTDCVLMHNGSYVNTGSFTIFTGVMNVHQELRKLLLKEFRLVKKPYEIDAIMRRGTITLENKELDIHPLIEQAISPVAMQILEEMEIFIPDFRELENIVLSGGGANVFGGYFQEKYGDMLTILGDSEFGNSEGYFKYGCFTNGA